MDKNSTILIIDDEPALLLGLAAKIKRQGYHVVTASDGQRRNAEGKRGVARSHPFGRDDAASQWI